MKQKLPTKRTLRHWASTLALAAMVLFAPTAWGQGLLTVYESATGTNEYVPFYGYYADATQQNQMIYPASELTDMVDSVITQMVFYIDHVSGSGNIGNWIVSLGETTATTLSGLDNTTALTQVYSGAMSFNSGETLMTVTFEEGYIYHGGNLLVEFNHPVTSGYKHYFFTGETVTGASYCYSGQRNFLPKVTFTYEAAPSCAKPTNVAVNNPTAHGATISWTGSSDSYVVMIGQKGLIASHNFETGSMPSDFTNDANRPWTVVSNTHSGSYCAKSANGFTSNNSDLVLTVNLTTAGSVEFSALVSSEQGWDFGRFLLDGMEKFSISGSSNSWEDYTFPLEAGTHTLTWRYYKDGSGNSGEDCFYVDDIVINTDPATWDETHTATASPYTFTTLSPETGYAVKVKGICGSDVSEPSAVVSFTTLESCAIPQNLAVTTDGQTATVTWNGTEGACNININGTVTNNVTSPYTFPVSLSTAYEVKVQAVCGNETSAWSNTASFTTPDCLGGHTIEYSLTDSYGDGWNGNAINIVDACGTVATLTIDNGAINSGVITLCGDYYQFKWQSGSYPGETSFTLIDNGTTIFDNQSGSSLSNNQVLHTIGTLTCPKPTSMAHSNVAARTADVDWTENGTATAWQICVNNDEDHLIDVTTHPYTLTSLTPETAYSVKVRAVCSATEQSCWADATSFTTNVACHAPTGLAAGNETTESATLTWTETGTATAWQICINNDETALINVSSANATISESTVNYTLTGLSDNTTISVKVRANCGGDDGNSAWTSELNVTTLPLCPAPVLEAAGITGVSAHNATVAWTGNTENDSYTVSYRTAAYFDGLNEEFGTSLPTGWENKTGLLSSIMGGSAFGTTTQWYFGTNNGVFDNHARINIYGTGRYGWLITPATSLETGYALNFDLALTAYSGTGAASGTCADDRFVVLVSTDDEATWTILREWNNSGSADVYNDIPTAGTSVTIDLSSYAGQSVRIAFYGESTVSGGDNNLHIDNVTCGLPVPAGAWTDVTNADNPTTLTTLAAETLYDVKVTGICTTGTNESATLQFTTPEACPAPTALTAGTPEAWQAQLSWTENGSASNWIVAYKTDAAADFTEVSVTNNPYTLIGLTPETQYTIKVRANCGINGGFDDGTSDWSNIINYTTEVACHAPTDLAVDNASITTNSADISWLQNNGSAMDWTVAYKAAGDADFTFIDEVLDNDPYTLENLTENTTYTVKVRAFCGTANGYSAWTPEVTFTTVALCPAPVLTDADITDVTAHNASVAWTGNAENNDYTLSYRTAAYFDGVAEDFPDGVANPTSRGWENKSGLLSDVMAGTTSLTSSYSWSFGNLNGVFTAPNSNHAAIGISSINTYGWLITPATSLGTGYVLNFDMALTYITPNMSPQAAQTTGTDDRFVVLVSTDDEATWTILREWNNTGSAYIYNDIAMLGENVTIDLSSYANQTVRIAFYGESTVQNAENHLHIDNVLIGAAIPASDWTNITDATSPTTLNNLSAETAYEVKVTGHCASNMESVSDTLQFTTDVACPVPTDLTFVSTALDVNVPTTANATITWTKHDESSWIVCVNDDETGAITVSSADVDDITGSTVTYTLTGLTPSTTPSVKVRANCGIVGIFDDGMSAWSTSLSFNTACGAITTFPWSENFESYAAGDFSNSCWVNEHISGNGSQVFKVATNTGSGNSTKLLQLPDMSNGTQTKLRLPEMTLPTTSSWLFSIDVYRNTSSYAQEGVRVYASTDGEIEGATELGFLYRNYTQTDGGVVTTESDLGWYTYEFPIPFTGTCYIILRGESQYGSSTYMDNFIVKVAPTCIRPSALQLSGTTTTSATLAWTPGDASQDAWEIAYSTTDFNPNDPSCDWTNITVAPVTSNPGTLTGLTASTTYYARVRANCGGGDYSEWSSAYCQFNTACEAVATGTTWTFEGMTYNATPQCWYRPTGAAGSTNVIVSYPHNGEQCLDFRGSTSGTLVVLPETEDEINTLQLRFWTRPESAGYSSCGTFSVGYVTDIDDATTFVAVETYSYNDFEGTNSSNTQYAEKTVIFVGAPAGARMAMRHNANSTSYYWFVDDVTVEAVPSCLPPQNLTATNVTATGATLNWTDPNSSVEDYSVMIILNGTDEVYHSIATSTSHPITNLAPATTYTFRVYTNCSSTESSTAYAEVTFTTACAAITTLPWTEDFESFSTAIVPTCWDNTASTAQEITSHPDYIWGVYENSSNKMIRMHNYYVHEGTALINTPTITLPSSEDYELTFDYSHRADCDAFSVKISTDGGANFTDLQQYTSTSTSYNYTEPVTFTAATVSLAGYTGDIILQFFANANYGSGAIFIDNVSVHLAPCAAVSDLVATATTATTATLSWTENGTATAWTVVYATANDFSEATSVDVSGTPTITLNSLTPATTYYVRVKSSCSDWSNVYSFTTQSAATLDIEANKWYAISSPMHDDGAQTESLANITNLLPTSAGAFAYDLFRYNEATSTWENQQNTVHTDFDVFEQARGYIYRRDNTAGITFVGTPNTGNISIDLTANADGDLQGFNLVGNPYYHTYTLNERCYSLTTDGSWEVHPTSYDLSIAEAVMVNTTTARTLTFTENTSSKGSHSAAPALAFTVKGGGLQDVAYATLTEGDGMPKLSHFNEAAPVLSIPVDGRRYAIADLGYDCESFDMTFRGIEGEYTLTLNANLSTLTYCHLIDRATGKDIDLLSNNSYTFTHSNTSTISDRFQVKLTPNVDENATGNFAYWNGNAWVVEGTGTLEVYDVVGRRVFTGNVDSQLSILNSQFPATGVYVLRMGDKNQKIVVR